ncbi:MAG: IS66 family transposase, partial [Marinifilaceae bacterium]
MTIQEDFIAFLQQQNEEYRKQITQLTAQVSELSTRIESLLIAIEKENEDVDGLQCKSKALAKLNGNVSEKVPMEHLMPAASKPSPKDRGNKNCKRKKYHPTKVEIVDVYPNDPAFDIKQAREIGIVESCRYVYRPGELVKIIFRQHNYSQDDTVYRSSAPAAPLLNSNYDGSFIAWMIYLHYIHSMPIERVIKMLREQGVELSKSTAHGLIRKSFDLLDRLSPSLREAILSDPYI